MKKTTLQLVLLIVAAIAPSMACGEPTFTPTPAALSPEEIVASAKPYTVFIEARFPGDREGSGTGIIFHEDGWIVTNAHVVEGASIIKVQVPERAGALSAQLFGVSPCDDLAVIKVPGSGFTKAQFGDSNALKQGESVIVTGYPLGQPDLSVTQGIVSKLHVTLDQLQDLIQTSAAVNPGNSGGPLLNMKGEVVGIITVKVQYDQAGNPVEGTAFAISSNFASADEKIPRLAQGVNIAWIGLNTIPLEDIDPTLEGLLIIGVSDNSPAERAGLQPLDVLVTMRGVNINSMADLCDVIRAGTGDIPYVIIRDGERISSEGTPAPVARVTPTPSPIPRAVGTETYTNRTLGFSLQYPEDWSIEEEEDRVSLSGRTPPILFSVKVDRPERSLTPQEVVDEWIKALKLEYPDFEETDIGELTMDGVEAVSQGGVFTEEGTAISIVIIGTMRGNLAYSIMIVGETADLDEVSGTLDAMFSSFRFLEGEAEAAVVFEDDFSDPTSGWGEYTTDRFEEGYKNGKYVILINDTNLAIWSNPDLSFDDFVLEVEATQVGGPDNNDYGVLFRYVDGDNFYRFAISGDGYYTVEKQQDDEWEPLVEWTPSPHINRGQSTNHLAVGAEGSRFSFYVNGEHLTDVTDQSFPEGDIGLIAGSFDEAGVLIHFDNVRVWVEE